PEVAARHSRCAGQSAAHTRLCVDSALEGAQCGLLVTAAVSAGPIRHRLGWWNRDVVVWAGGFLLPACFTPPVSVVSPPPNGSHSSDVRCYLSGTSSLPVLPTPRKRKTGHAEEPRAASPARARASGRLLALSRSRGRVGAAGRLTGRTAPRRASPGLLPRRTGGEGTGGRGLSPRAPPPPSPPAHGPPRSPCRV